MVKKIHAGTPWKETQAAPTFVSVHAGSWRCGYRHDGLSSSGLWSLTLLPRAVGVWFHLWIVSAWQGSCSTCIRWRHKVSMEASGFILEQIIGVHSYPYLSSYPCVFIREVKVVVCGVAWCHCVQQGVTCCSWAPWEMLGASWDPDGFVPHSRRSYRWGLLFEGRTCKEGDVLISSLVLEGQMKVKLSLSALIKHLLLFLT